MRTRSIVPVLALFAFTAAAFAAGPGSAGPDVKKLPGYIDGSAFADLAGEDDEVVEVNLSGSLLRALASKDAEEGGDDSVFRKLQSIQAYVITLGKNNPKASRADAMIKEVEQRLTAGGWERLARVREKDERVGVYVRGGEKTVDGLTVLVHDRGDNEVVFVNIVGDIDLNKINQISDKFDIPGLEAVPGGGNSVPPPKRSKPSDETPTPKPGKGGEEEE